MRCLAIHLSGTMCSWGDAFIGSYRSTDLHPSKSSVVGIISAAMGIGRDERQTPLFTDYDYAVAASGLETKVRDYHTVQVSRTPQKEEVVRGGMRRMELERGDLNTILSEREYVCNGYYSVFVFPKDSCEYTLEAMRDALENPVYTPYLGRKSCPLSYPMCPEIIEGDRAYDMVASNVFKPFIGDMERMFRDWERTSGRIYSTFPLDGTEPFSEEVRRDDMADRRRWQFSERREYCYRVMS